MVATGNSWYSKLHSIITLYTMFNFWNIVIGLFYSVHVHECCMLLAKSKVCHHTYGTKLANLYCLNSPVSPRSYKMSFFGLFVFSSLFVHLFICFVFLKRPIFFILAGKLSAAFGRSTALSPSLKMLFPSVFISIFLS